MPQASNNILTETAGFRITFRQERISLCEAQNITYIKNRYPVG